MKETLTALERKALNALLKSAYDCSGGDFALVEETKWDGDRKQLGGLLTSLQQKRAIIVNEPVETNGGPKEGGERWTQVEIADEYKEEYEKSRGAA